MADKLKLTPEQQADYDDMRASPGILIDPDGNVVFDGEAKAMGAKPFRTLAEIQAQENKLEAQLAAHAYRKKFDRTIEVESLDPATWEAATELLKEAVREEVPFSDEAEFKGALKDATT